MALTGWTVAFAAWLNLADFVGKLWGAPVGMMFAVSPFVLVGGLFLWLVERRK